MSTFFTIPAEHVQLLDDDALDAQTLAQGCHMSVQWVHARVETGVLAAHSGGDASTWRFASTTLTRARRIAQLERSFDADPQLAALTADLMEEVTHLRRLLGTA